MYQHLTGTHRPRFDFNLIFFPLQIMLSFRLEFVNNQVLSLGEQCAYRLFFRPGNLPLPQFDDDFHVRTIPNICGLRVFQLMF